MAGEHIRRIDHKGADAGLGHFSPEVGIEGLTHDGAFVQLEVTGVDHAALGAVDHKACAFGNRV